MASFSLTYKPFKNLHGNESGVVFGEILRIRAVGIRSN